MHWFHGVILSNSNFQMNNCGFCVYCDWTEGIVFKFDLIAVLMMDSDKGVQSQIHGQALLIEAPAAETYFIGDDESNG